MSYAGPAPALQAHYRAQGYWNDDTLAVWLARAAQQRPDAPALIAGGAAISYAQLQARVTALANALHTLGIAKGQVVAVQLPNLPEFIIAYLAITARGAVMQTLHMPYRNAELAPLLAHSGAVAAICMAQAKDYPAGQTFLDLRAELPALRHVICVGPPPAGAHDFAALLAQNAPAAPALPLTGSDDFLLLYTSGTTSRPKGVPHAYRNFLSNSRLSAQALEISPDDRLLCAAPYTHLYGLFTFNMALSVGAACVLLPAFTPPDLARLMDEGKPTAVFAAPAHIAACFGMKLFEGRNLSSIRYAQLSGSAVPPELARRLEKHLPNGKVMQLWGMTELQAGAFTRTLDPEPVRAETTGCPPPGTELRIAGTDDAALSAGETGELQVRGPSLFSGYLNDAAATDAAFTADGWFRTGDLAVMDADGNVALSGRTKDIINRGGVKINPLDVETLLLEHPAVEQAAIVPMPDPVLGERACCFVVTKGGAALNLEEMQAFLAARQVSKVKWPERLEIIAAMPMTPTRKVIKGELARRLDLKE